jgi:hypothetical protein
MAEQLDAKAIHTGLIEQIKAWEFQPDFKQSGRQKLNRSLNLLAGTDPDVLVNLLGVKEVPANPRDAMNLIRGLDLKTLKKLEIFTGGDMKLGDKIVGHHIIAANTIGEALAGMDPAERMKVYAGIAERGEKIGMDPRQIIQIWDETHKDIAHGGDFKGKKTGAFLGYIAGEDADGFLERFDKSAELQKRMKSAAQDVLINRNLTAGIQGASQALGLEDLTSGETPIDYKGKATTVLSNWTNPIRDILKTASSPEDAFQKVGDLVSEGAEQLPTRAKNLLSAIQTARPGAIAGGVAGNVLGARPGLADAESIAKGTSTGDWTPLAVDTGVGAVTGGLAQAGIQKLASMGRVGLANAARAMGIPLAAAGLGNTIANVTFKNEKVQKAYAEADNPLDRIKSLGAAFMPEDNTPKSWQESMFDGAASSSP